MLMDVRHTQQMSVQAR